MSETISLRIHDVLTRELIVDLTDRMKAEAYQAAEAIRNGTRLKGVRARGAEGQVRFRMMEAAFEEECSRHGGVLIEGGVFPETGLKFYQPFFRFGSDGHGVILGLASIPEPKALPAKNMSRRAAVPINYKLQPCLDLDGTGPKVGDIFALLLVARDPERSGHIQQMAIGVIDARYETYLYCKPIEEFMAGYADAAGANEPLNEASRSLSLKKNVKPFVPPEAPEPDRKDVDKGSSA